MRRSLVAVVALVLALPTPAHAEIGDRDPSWGIDGRVELPVDDGRLITSTVTAADDGRSIVTGMVLDDDGVTTRAYAALVSATGEPTVLDVGGFDQATGAAFSGSALFVAVVDNADQTVDVLRFLPDGRLDAAFDADLAGLGLAGFNGPLLVDGARLLVAGTDATDHATVTALDGGGSRDT